MIISVEYPLEIGSKHKGMIIDLQWKDVECSFIVERESNQDEFLEQLDDLNFDRNNWIPWKYYFYKVITD